MNHALIVEQGIFVLSVGSTFARTSTYGEFSVARRASSFIHRSVSFFSGMSKLGGSARKSFIWFNMSPEKLGSDSCMYTSSVMILIVRSSDKSCNFSSNLIASSCVVSKIRLLWAVRSSDWCPCQGVFEVLVWWWWRMLFYSLGERHHWHFLRYGFFGGAGQRINRLCGDFAALL